MEITLVSSQDVKNPGNWKMVVQLGEISDNSKVYII